MESAVQILDESKSDVAPGARREFALEVLCGLSEAPKRIPSRFFYDARGSELFSRIMELEEYYPTRCEAQILDSYKAQLAELWGPATFNLVDLGAGDGRKTAILLKHLSQDRHDFHYVPIDISRSAVERLAENVARAFADVSVRGVVAEYFDGIRSLSGSGTRRNVVMFLGSNVGNFTGAEARRFLRELWDALNPGDQLLIGFDLKKDIDVLTRAYSDSAGVTAAFNLNLLRRINRELGGEFDLGRFRHHAVYDVRSGAMQSYLVSLRRQSVRVKDLHRTFDFEAWEPIHTESSYKYLPSDIDGLAAATGFEVVRQYFDRLGFFSVNLWRVDKKP